MTNKDNNDNNLEASNAVNNLSANAIEDLNLQEEDATEIKGGLIGMLLPAVQKIR